MSDRLLASLDGHPVPPTISAPGYTTPPGNSSETEKVRRGQAAYTPVPLTLPPIQVLYCVTVTRDGKRYFVGNEREESGSVRNPGEATPRSASSQDVRCRQVDDSEKLLISLD